MTTELKNKIEQVKLEIIQIESAISVRSIDRCNCVIQSNCGNYTVGVSKESNNATIDFSKTHPVFFSLETAKEIQKNFKASNGKGNISWKIISKYEFYKWKLNELKDFIQLFEQ